jgi:hypothetical protein
MDKQLKRRHSARDASGKLQGSMTVDARVRVVDDAPASGGPR